MGKPVWATGISSKRRNKAQVYRLHHRSGDSGFVIRNAMEKVFIVLSLTNFCSSGPVIHLQGLRFTDLRLIDGLKCPHEPKTFYVCDVANQTGFVVF